MSTLINIGISIVASAVIFFAGMNLPASNFSLKSLTDPNLGAFTEISTATNLADFPTTYNANLNKTIEVGTTSVASITTLGGLTSAAALATVGTITSGTWNGSVIDVARQGTGSTSPTANQVILGNGSSGFKVVAGFGSSGQFLTSGGAATPPTWTTSAIDQGISYNWTAHHIFTSLFATNASSTNATTTNLYVSGTPTFTTGVNKKFYLNTSTTGISASQASSTIFSVSVPANTLSTSNAISCKFAAPTGSTVNTAKLKIDVSYGGTASSSVMTGAMGAGSGNLYVNGVSFLLSATGATNTQSLMLYEPDVYDDSTRQAGIGVKVSTPNIDSTVAQTLYFVAAFATANGTIPAGQVVCSLIR